MESKELVTILMANALVVRLAELCPRFAWSQFIFPVARPKNWIFLTSSRWVLLTYNSDNKNLLSLDYYFGVATSCLNKSHISCRALCLTKLLQRNENAWMPYRIYVEELFTHGNIEIFNGIVRFIANQAISSENNLHYRNRSWYTMTSVSVSWYRPVNNYFNFSLQLLHV